MPKPALFSEAVAFWTAHRDEATDFVWDEFDASERLILGHRPTCPAEATAMIAVLLDQADARGDGLHLVALGQIGQFLQEI